MEIKSSWPFFEKDEIEAAQKVLESGKINYWTGDNGKCFEIEYADFCGTNRSIALANGSLALSAAYQAIKLNINDEIITTPRSFVATASEAYLKGAKPVFADVDLHSGNITTETIEPLINSKTKAISIVHIGGWPANMPDIIKLANHYNLAVIEDCSQAHGARINDRSVGSFGDIGTWSFCQEKIISTGGEGGMITTNNEELFKDIQTFKDHGKNFDLIKKKANTKSSYRFLHENLGTNIRLTEMQSAIGRIQLTKLAKWNKIRERNALLLREIINESKAIEIPLPSEGFKHAWYKLYGYINPKYLLSDWDRDRIIKEIISSGAPAFSGSCSELYLEKCFYNLNQKRLPNARILGEQSLMLLVDQTFDEEIIEKYGKIVLSVLKRATC